MRFAQSGNKIVNFSIATSDTWKDKESGERREKTEWHRIVIFSDGLATIAEKYLKKGSKVYVEGALQTRKWTGNDGIEKYTTEVILQGFNGTLTMLDSRSDSSLNNSSDTQEMAGWDNQEKAIGQSEVSDEELDDEIPF